MFHPGALPAKVFFLIFTSAIILSGCFNQPVMVPNLVGLSEADASAALQDVALSVGAVTEVFSATVAEGNVISQNPPAGTDVNPGTAVDFVVSKGPEPVTVPNVVGSTQSNAEATITVAGLTVGSVTQVFDDTTAAGTVLAQDPASGESVLPGTAVSLTVSKGPEPVEVPDVVGETQASAEAMITAAGLVVGTVTEVFSNTVPAGTVVSQDPASGSRVLPGTSVALTISGGPEPVLVPDVVGETQASAEATITGAGLAVGAVAEVFSDTVPAGIVVSQDPLSGATVLPGTSVALSVSKGPEPVLVPDVVGETQANAEAAITGAGLSLGTVAEVFNNTVPEGNVVSQNPASGSSVPAGTSISLTVSKGLAPAKVPDVVGYKQAIAEGAIEAVGLVARPVNQVFSDTVPPGDVISQDPEAGTNVVFGTEVALVVSKGPEQPGVPFVVGLAREDAERIIEEAGFVVGTVVETNDSYQLEGRVYSQTPVSSTGAAPGSTVDLWVSLGPSGGTTHTIWLPGRLPLEMVWVPAGTYLQGANDFELAARPEEYPQHEVTLSRGFWMGKYEITKEQYLALVGEAPWAGSEYVLDEPDTPAVLVSWNEATACLDALRDATGLTFRLPTEAEWEYAARAGTTTRYYWGDDPDYTVGDDYEWWVYNAWAEDEPYSHPVGQKIPNAFGLYDMLGNAQEWCNDFFGDYEVGAVTDPLGPVEGEFHVLRGGAFGGADIIDGGNWRAARRAYGTPDYKRVGIGFRVVVEDVVTREMQLVLAGGRSAHVTWIPPGNFRMGRSEGEQDSSSAEDPQHRVRISKGFWMGKYEVTKGEWFSVMGTRPWEDQWGVIPDSDSPAVYISWEDAQEFITRVNRLSGSGFRLPTEAEWEYACRAATTSRFYWGDDPEYQEGDAYAWWPATAINAGEAYAHPVGLLEPNPWGLFDMAGNAWEWCQDWYGPYAPGDQTDPTGPSTGTERVGRGGSWGAIDPAHCRSAYRGKNRPDYGGSSGIGFRLVR